MRPIESPMVIRVLLWGGSSLAFQLEAGSENTTGNTINRAAGLASSLTIRQWTVVRDQKYKFNINTTADSRQRSKMKVQY